MENNFAVVILVFLMLNYFFFLLKILRGLNKLSYKSVGFEDNTYVSVIIPFRNEAENILSSLNSMENQDYDKSRFEVIYVNDNSEDSSPGLLCDSIKSENIKIISVNTETGRTTGHKKTALLAGIRESRGDIIITTDADCTHSPGWIKSLVNCFSKDTAMAAGAVEIKESNKLFSRIQRLEFKGLIVAGAGLIGSRMPVICSGANLAYRKNIFFDAGGFNSEMDFSSGDDELLMQKISRQPERKIRFCTDYDALVTTQAADGLSGFLQQRSRWASKSLFYRDKKLIIRLLLIFLFYASLPVMVVLSFSSDIFILLFTSAVLIKFFTEYTIMRKGSRLIFNSDEVKPFLITEVFQIIYIIVAAVSGAFGNFRWKGRKLKR